MTYEITGIYHQDLGTVTVSDKFRRREFVVQVQEIIHDKIMLNYVKLQLVMNKVEMLDNYTIGDKLLVKFYLKGMVRYNQKSGKAECINNLQVGYIEKL